MSNTAALHIIIVEDDVNDYESLISTIKSGGFAVRAKRAEDADELTQALNGHVPDMVLFSHDAEDIDLSGVINCLDNNNKQTPVLVLGNSDKGKTVEYLKQGAADYIDKEDSEHLKLVVSRTARAQSHWKKLQQFELALNETEKRCRVLLDSSRDAICYVHEGMHTYANHPYLELFGYTSQDELDDIPIMDLVYSDDQAKMKDFLRNRKQSGAESTLEVRLVHANGKSFDAILEFCSASVDGEPCTQIIIRDQTSTKELEEQINYLSVRDISTGLYNRQFLLDRLENIIETAINKGGNASLIQTDIGNLADIKERFGVTATDQVIVDIARVLKQACKKTDMVARFSDETFMTISSAYSDEELEAHANRIATTIANHTTDIDGKSIIVQPCVGALHIDEESPDVNELLLRAKNASEQAWELESESAVIYTPKEGEMTQKQIDEAWSTRLREAIKDKRLRILFQPIVSLHGDTHERYEVSLELRDEADEIVPQEEYLPSAERTGFLRELDQWMISSSVQRLATVRQSKKNTSFMIRITAGTLQNTDFPEQLLKLLQTCKVPPTNLIFSAREQDVVNYLKSVKGMVKSLQDAKCKFSLDNFGTGMNPMQIIKAVPANYAKLDESIMKDLRKHPENQETIEGLAESLKASQKILIAPNVDDAETLSILWGMGIDYIQGSFLQAPAETLDYDFTSMG